MSDLLFALLQKETEQTFRKRRTYHESYNANFSFDGQRGASLINKNLFNRVSFPYPKGIDTETLC